MQTSNLDAMFTYDRVKERDRQGKGQDHCRSTGAVYDLVDLIAEGTILDPRDMANVLTVGRSVGKRAGVLIYAVDENFQIKVGFDGTRGTDEAVKHETLFHNADVRAAGELEIEGGVILEVGDSSGTYGTQGRLQTDHTFADAVLRALDGIAAPIDAGERRRLERRAGR